MTEDEYILDTPVVREFVAGVRDLPGGPGALDALPASAGDSAA